MNAALRRGGRETPDPPGGEGTAGESGSSVPERLIALETELKHLATKTEIQKLKVWVLGGVLGGMALAATIAIAAVRLFVD